MNFEELKAFTKERKALEADGEVLIFDDWIDKQFAIIERLYSLFKELNLSFDSRSELYYEIDTNLRLNDVIFRIAFENYDRDCKLHFYQVSQDGWYEDHIPREDILKLLPDLVFIIDEL